MPHKQSSPTGTGGPGTPQQLGRRAASDGRWGIGGLQVTSAEDRAQWLVTSDAHPELVAAIAPPRRYGLTAAPHTCPRGSFTRVNKTSQPWVATPAGTTIVCRLADGGS
jgi:hypothetical protein